MAVPDSDEVRAAMFAYLDGLQRTHGPRVTTEQLLTFTFNGEALPLLEKQKGIRKPAGWDTALTIRSTSRAADAGGYDDERTDDGLLYQFMRSGASYAAVTNESLVQAMRHERPLAYLVQVDAGVYEPVYPVYITDRRGDAVLVSETPASGEYGTLIDIRRYAESSVRRRLHQSEFRARVLYSYGDRCCICRLARRGLLDAAHIVDDAHENGFAIVANGLSMCRIHHGAYDQMLFGIRPDYTIDVAVDVLDEIDGPMLQQAFKDAHGQKINVPAKRTDQPDPERLEWKYERFRSAS